jgi:phage tail protein X
MADYPDWVMKHKKKGTYINYVKGKYYLYAAHSERIPGTKKVVRVSDGYIGRITEKDGLIPAREKVTGDVIVCKYGLHMTALALCDLVLKGLRREFRGAADHIIVTGILLAVEGIADENTFADSYLSIIFPDVNASKALTEKQQTGAERCKRMVLDKLNSAFGNDGSISASLSRVYAVFVNKKEYISKMPAGVAEWLKDNGIDWRGTI